ncbi:hypothetical protein QAD02_022855 [Eretmocerus hayati]|uniref:Uncharacterized protein n=1 Tax=Eretmocerus hayati TaxID=131215 RepID=A0ACC2PVU6_9HYME|nr:hypothetical protein QAD02_022855 [Eretmocerus hayati]
MSALTLVLRELPGVDPDEFFYVRAYHTSCWKDLRTNMNSIGTSSPTRSRSSSCSGYGTASESESMTHEATSSGNLNRQVSSKPQHKWLKKHIKKSSVEKEKPQCEIKEENRIMHEGRDILNSSRNLAPSAWQLISPLSSTLNPYGSKDYRPNHRFIGDLTFLDCPMTTCSDCNFVQPQLKYDEINMVYTSMHNSRDKVKCSSRF